jgi:glutaredoxin
MGAQLSYKSSAPPAAYCAASVHHIAAVNPVTVFSTTICPLCVKAKNLLDDVGTKYHSVELNKMMKGEGGRLAMGLHEVTGEGTVPQVRRMREEMKWQGETRFAF